MPRFAAVLLLSLVSSFAIAADESKPLPSWFPKPDGLYHVVSEQYFDHDSFNLAGTNRKLPDGRVYETLTGHVWKVDVGSTTPAFWSSLRVQLEKQGFTLIDPSDAKDPNPSLSKFIRGSGDQMVHVEYWNRHMIAIVEAAPNPLHVTLTPPGKTPETVGPKADIPYLSPLPGSRVVDARETSDGIVVETDCKKGISERTGTVVFERVYSMPAGASDLAAREAYEPAFRAAGWDYTCESAARWLYAHYTRNGRDVWAKIVTNAPHDYMISVADTAVGLREDLKKKCKASLYGVNFDFNKATLRPDSEPALNQLLALLKDEPKVAVEIGGHTDNVGKPDYNLKLSDERAASVKQWLIAHGIAAFRLTSRGYGDTQPLVPNSSDDNRAKNRRVEVKRTDCK